LVQLLAEKGVTVFSATSDSLIGNVARVRGRRSAAEMVASGSSTVRNAELPLAPTRGYATLIAVGGLLLLLPAMVYGNNIRRRRQTQANRSASDGELSRQRNEFELSEDRREQLNRSASYEP
ncbi:MAG: hypothetical protein ACRDAP_05460, partial [Shewanella sp.]